MIVLRGEGGLKWPPPLLELRPEHQVAWWVAM